MYMYVYEIIGRILYEALGLHKFHKIKSVLSVLVAAIENFIKQVAMYVYIHMLNINSYVIIIPHAHVCIK